MDHRHRLDIRLQNKFKFKALSIKGIDTESIEQTSADRF